MNFIFKGFLTFLFCCSALVCASSSKIIVGSKLFTESRILAELVVLLIEDRTSYQAEHRSGLGTTQVVYEALKKKQIHIYPDYTGTVDAVVMKNILSVSKDKTLKRVTDFLKKEGVDVSPLLGFSNTYALAIMKQGREDLNGIQKISDIKKRAKKLKLGGNHEFMEREDGFKGLIKRYDLKNQLSPLSVDHGLVYGSLQSKKIDVAVVYSTEGKIMKFDLRLIDDDKSYFPPYQAFYLTNAEDDTMNRAIQEVTSVLAGKISENEMMQMNFEVSQSGLSPKFVANEFLIKKGLLSKSKSFEEKRVFWDSTFVKTLVDHIVLSLVALLLALCIALPLGVAMSRVPLVYKIGAPIVNLLQTVPSIALLGAMVPLLGIGVVPALVALCVYSLLPIVKNTHLGFEQIDKTYLELAKGMGLTKRQIFWSIEWPLALPVVLTGIRLSLVIVIGTATLASLIGAGGLGDYIFRGVATMNNQLILKGAIPASLLAVFLDKLLLYIQNRVVSKGLRREAD